MAEPLRLLRRTLVKKFSLAFYLWLRTTASEIRDHIKIISPFTFYTNHERQTDSELQRLQAQ